MKALVTGSAGFVGRHLCPKLEKAGFEVSRFDSAGDGFSLGEFLHHVPQMTYDVIVHLAANIVNVDERMKMGLSAYDDIALDLEFLKWVEKNPPTRALVLMSSCAVDFPDDPYCIVKRNLESFAKTLVKQGVPVIVLRPFSGYGEDQSEEYPFRAILERALRKEDPLTVWGGNQVRDWIHIDDLTDGILWALADSTVPRDATPIEVGTGVPTDISSLARIIVDQTGYRPQLRRDSSKVSSSPWRVAGIMGEKRLQDFAWAPKISLEEGIRRAVEARMAAVAHATCCLGHELRATECDDFLLSSTNELIRVRVTDNYVRVGCVRMSMATWRKLVARIDAITSPASQR